MFWSIVCCYYTGNLRFPRGRWWVASYVFISITLWIFILRNIFVIGNFIDMCLCILWYRCHCERSWLDCVIKLSSNYRWWLLIIIIIIEKNFKALVDMSLLNDVPFIGSNVRNISPGNLKISCAAEILSPSVWKFFF